MGSGDAFPHDGAAIKPSVESSAKGSDLEALTSTVTSSGRKNGGSKDIGYSVLNSINKSTSQIKKPNHRKIVSPLNWFPRKRADSFLKRKIKHLQEIAGMNLSLDETLGNANPHYTRITREKIAAREAAQKAMEARKAALVEASWCRILGAARINSKEAEARLQKAEKCAEEAFEAARSLGVMMYDRPDSQRRPYEIETSLGIGGKSTHKVTAAFETAFDVDKEVTAAVKRAFVMLANCSSSSSKEEFRNLLCKISQNPDINRSTEGLLDTSSELESHSVAENVQESHGSDDANDKKATNPSTEGLPDASSELESHPVAENEQESHGSDDANNKKTTRMKQTKHNTSLLSTSDGSSSSSMSPTKLTNNMFDRLKCLHEDELSSLAVIVATCGLNAALREMKRTKNDDVESVTTEVPGLDKFLVKHISKLEKEVQEARKSNAALEDNRKFGTLEKQGAAIENLEPVISEVPSLDKFLVKHVSKLEQEVHEAKKNSASLEDQRMLGTLVNEDVKRKLFNHEPVITEVPSLDKFLVKHVSKLEREIQEAKKNNAVLKDHRILGKLENEDVERKLSEIHEEKSMESNLNSEIQTEIMRTEPISVAPPCDNILTQGEECNKENKKQIPIKHLHKTDKCMSRDERAKLEVLKAFSKGYDDTLGTIGHDKILSKPMHWLAMEKIQNMEPKRHGTVPKGPVKHGNNITVTNSLDKILLKHVSQLEKEKQAWKATEVVRKGNKTKQQSEELPGLDEIMVKRQSKLEKAKQSATQESADYVKHETRREAREKELEAAWGGLSLGNSMRSHLSRIEQEKAAWRKAEEEGGTLEMEL
ncbi:uncharacterized protein LOC122043398 isoform X1 [Zingiber officinale]|uniref:uncharacterized protein LOC122043398 isoform X1 n=1 Tax=Zingiber officinale TaxID=94328 RepID=UPI001C4D4C65|nr:uncharacterized protein LOC122043398 isoform X1 [Zingiber officinale]